MSSSADTETATLRESKTSISVCIISFDEENNIGDCIDLVAWCDEVVVVGSFGEGRSVETARKRTAKVIENEWPGHEAQKNFALDAATCEWVIALDYDERIAPSLREAIFGRLGSPQEICGYFISRKIFYLGRWREHGGGFPQWHLQLLRRNSGH